MTELLDSSLLHVVDIGSDELPVSLSPMQLAAILSALQKVGAYGEVRLIVSKRRIRFIQIVQSRPFPKSFED